MYIYILYIYYSSDHHGINSIHPEFHDFPLTFKDPHDGRPPVRVAGGQAQGLHVARAAAQPAAWPLALAVLGDVRGDGSGIDVLSP